MGQSDQAALTSLSGDPTGRLPLSVTRCSGRTSANARANIAVNALGRALIFDDRGPVVGAVICLSGASPTNRCSRSFTAEVH